MATEPPNNHCVQDYFHWKKGREREKLRNDIEAVQLLWA